MLRKYLKLAPLVLGLSCARGYLAPLPKPADAGVKVVERVIDYANERSWQNSGYWRIDDPPGQWPWFAVVSGNTACPSWEHELRVPNRGDYYQCKSQWRVWRR
jgi:hypothetical protein